VTKAGLPTPRSGRGRALARRFDPNTWSGCVAIMVALGVLLVLVEVVNAADDQRLDRFGLHPRVPSGLVGIVTMPFLHASFGHLMANIFPFVIVGWVVLVGGFRDFLLTTLVIMVGGGLVTWIVGPDATIVGASALIFGWLGYLVARAIFSRRFLWIMVAAGMLLFFGGLFVGLLPSASHDYIAWQAHLCGFVAGGAAGWWLHPRRGTDRYLRVQARVTRT
jgi:membrane associated rhomboid family serine protease